MALNWTMINEGRNPVPLPFEMIIKYIEDAELSLTIPDAPPSGSTTSGGSGGTKKPKCPGRIWLTDQRFVFVSDLSKTGKTAPSFDSLSVPLTSIISTSFQQPLLGSNFLIVSISPSPGGGLTDGTKADVRCSGRLFELAAALSKTRERAIEAMRNVDSELEEGLPTYSTDAPVSAASGPSTAIGGGLDLPPAYS